MSESSQDLDRPSTDHAPRGPLSDLHLRTFERDGESFAFCLKNGTDGMGRPQPRNDVHVQIDGYGRPPEEVRRILNVVVRALNEARS
jgi:hypothetical protein